MSEKFSIARCTAEQRPEALRLLHEGLPSDQQAGLVHALKAVPLKAVQGEEETEFAGLLAAIASVPVALDSVVPGSVVPGSIASDKVVGAVWAQLSAGQAATVWLPAASCPASHELMVALAMFLDENKIDLAQFLAGADDSTDSELLDIANFQKLARLAYLTVDCQPTPPLPPQGKLAFLPNAGDQPERLGELLLRTYVDSQDCPKLNGIRNAIDVLEGYRDQGICVPECWFFVQHEGQDIGALILTTYPENRNWELVYMGLVPETRGSGWGRQILDFAVRRAHEGGAERLVLAVDEANSYALAMYERAGFVAWDYRTVYGRLRKLS